MLLIETVLVVLSVVVALLWPEIGSNFWAPLEKGFTRLAKRRKVSVVIVGTAALGVRLVLLPVLAIPEPAIHDEFSYLLAADTFAHWRLANPPHPMWIHFETFHVIQQPTYVSMYYPAQGMFLAVGQLLFHHPFWGVWLSCGLMCGAICWMLQAWIGPVWALLGGLLAVIRLAAFSYWDNSYWGGAVAALAGALVLGALPRIMRAQKLRDALMMGVGFALVANSRPYETVFFGCAVLAVLALCWVKRRSTRVLTRVVSPLAVVIFATALFMAYYNWRTTGNLLRSPYFVNLATYNSVPYFPWQSLKTPVEYHHPLMQRFYLQWWLMQYRLAQLHPGMFTLLKTYVFWAFFLGPLLTLPLLVAILQTPANFSLKKMRRRTRILLFVFALVAIGAVLPAYFNPHYIAAITSALYAIVLIGLQQTRHLRLKERAFGVAIVRSVPLIALLMFAVRLLAPSLHISNPYAPATWASPEKQNFDRARILSELSRQPGDHLVLVRYTADHTLSNEWVYNGADIDGSKVIWARDMGREQNMELLRFFAQRHTWLVEPDTLQISIRPYQEAR